MSAPTSDLSGFVYVTGSSRRLPARMVVRGDDLTLVGDDDTDLGRAPMSDVAFGDPLGRAARKLTFPDGTIFETHNHAAIDALIGPTHGATLHYLEAFNARLFAVVAVCLAAAWLLWRYGLDILTAAAIAMTPPVMIEQIDKGSMQTIDFVMAEPSQLSQDDKDKVSAIYKQLVAALPAGDQEKHSFDLLFRHMPGTGPNAFALPGGTMIMTDEFVDRFGEPDILAGVLGHEIGHVVEQHGLRRIYRSLSMYILVSFLAGDTGPLLEDIILEGNLLLSLSFDRHQESSADEFGLTLARDAGFDPAGLKVFFEEMAREYGASEPAQWMSTHPSSEERTKAIQDFIDSL